jgi:hypothetical protein
MHKIGIKGWDVLVFIVIFFYLFCNFTVTSWLSCLLEEECLHRYKELTIKRLTIKHIFGCVCVKTSTVELGIEASTYIIVLGLLLSVWSLPFLVESSRSRFLVICLYLCYRRRSTYQKRVEVSINRFNHTTMSTCSKQWISIGLCCDLCDNML